MESIETLIEQYLKVVGSQANAARREFWDNADEPYLLERWRGRSRRSTGAPFTMALDISGYAPMVGINCADYYTTADANLRDQLRYALWEAEHLDCDRYFEPTVFCSIGSVFEASFFGAKINYPAGQAPWYDEKVSVFEKKEDLLRLKPFDFNSTGLCPRVIEFYEHHRRICEPYGLTSMFPVTMRSPFSTAIMLRGFQNLLMDIYDDPDFFNELMATVTGYIKEFSAARARYLGEPVASGVLFNDEISTPMLSAAMYRELIMPYEVELAEFWGGLRYWHSCGTSEAFYEDVATLPGLKMMHVGPWSDIGRAAEVFGTQGADVCLDICVNSNRDMYEKTEEEMTAHLEGIKALCEGRVRYAVRCDGIAVRTSPEELLDKTGAWSRAARRVFHA